MPANAPYLPSDAPITVEYQDHPDRLLAQLRAIHGRPRADIPPELERFEREYGDQVDGC